MSRAMSSTNDQYPNRFSLNLVDTYETHRSCVGDIKKAPVWGKKQRSAFNTLLTGLKVADKLNKKTRFLTLSTSDIQKNNINGKSLNLDFQRLKQRIKRITVGKLIQQGYMKTSDIRRYYDKKPIGERFKFDYFKVVTNEGNGVLHIVYVGEYLPYNYVVDNWQDIHNSWNINIKAIKSKLSDFKKSSRYIVTQYLSCQGSSYQRSSQSWNWIFRGYRKAWKEFLVSCHVRYFYNAVQRRFYLRRELVDIFQVWEDSIMALVKPPPIPIPQSSLF